MGEIGIIVDALADMAESVESFVFWHPQLRDPCQEMVLVAAVNGRAGTIMTFNRRDDGGVPARFGIEVLSSGEMLRRMR